jgi:type I restriction enzyme S subunit
MNRARVAGAERVPPLRRYKRYPAYKDSGVEWLEEIPAHWEVKRLKYVAPARLSKLDVKPDDAVYVGLEHIESWTCRLLLENQPETVDSVVGSFKAGDVLFGKLRPYLAKVARPDFDGVCTSEILPLRPVGECSQSYLMYALLNAAYIYWLDSLTYGTKMPRVSPEQVAVSFVSLPPVPEQRAIAAFLDRETARIDALVAKKERLIELLQEKRTALITRAVTKGLDPTVPMKDSGVEWLGEIPAHWEVLALKRRAKRIQTGTTPPTSETTYYEDGVVAWYGPGSFADELPLQAPTKFIAESAVRDGVARVFESGTAVIVTIGATIGKVAFMERAGSCNQQITGVTFDRQRVDARYGAYQLKRLEPVLRGIAPNTTLPILDQEEVGYLPFAIPPDVEQRAIAAFLDHETARIDALIAKVHDAIDRLKELRTALISAAVTGKIDVREEVAA